MYIYYILLNNNNIKLINKYQNPTAYTDRKLNINIQNSTYTLRIYFLYLISIKESFNLCQNSLVTISYHYLCIELFINLFILKKIV